MTKTVTVSCPGHSVPMYLKHLFLFLSVVRDGIEATDHRFRASLHLNGGLGWDRDARFYIKNAPRRQTVTVSCLQDNV